MTYQLQLFHAWQANQFFGKRKSPGVVSITDRSSPDIQCPRRSKPADCRIAPVNLARDLNGLGHVFFVRDFRAHLQARLHCVSGNVEGEFDLISHAHESMRCRCCFDFEVTAINAEFTLRSQIISSDGDLCWNRDLVSHTMQRDLSGNL